jgi:hypothetical protein
MTSREAKFTLERVASFTRTEDFEEISTLSTAVILTAFRRLIADIGAVLRAPVPSLKEYGF